MSGKTPVFKITATKKELTLQQKLTREFSNEINNAIIWGVKPTPIAIKDPTRNVILNYVGGIDPYKTEDEKPKEPVWFDVK